MASSARRTRVLALVDYYLPGFKAGGPMRSIAGAVERLTGTVDFMIATRDRDLGESGPYPTVPGNAWVEVGAARCRYLAPDELSFRALTRLMKCATHDVLYLNSLFSVTFGIKPLVLRRLGRGSSSPTVIAPRGELNPGALGLHAIRKRAYLRVARLLGLAAGVTWHASNPGERVEIRRWFGTDAEVIVSAPTPSTGHIEIEPAHPGKAADRLRVVFLARVSPIKNLHGALEILSGVRGRVELDVYGPIEDGSYWNRCKRIIATLPPNVAVHYRGPVRPHKVLGVLGGYDLFFLPTFGEGYGHAIFEALAAGCPVLISDQTPWKDLDSRGIGWDLPLEDGEGFKGVIERCISMHPGEHTRLSAAARHFALRTAADDAPTLAAASLFETALAAR